MAGIISVILTFITPPTKIYHVNFIATISDEVEYQRLFIREISKEDIYLEITESINDLTKLQYIENNSCKIALNNNSYNTFKYRNFYLIEFQLSHNKMNLNAVNECYGEFEQIIKKINNKYIRLAEFIYTEKYAFFNHQNDKSKNSYNLQFFLNNNEIKLNKNILFASKKINETKHLFDNKTSRFFSYFIILSFLFAFLINYKKFELLIKKQHY
jgi:hypothetical protein